MLYRELNADIEEERSFIPMFRISG
jgi:hypothetical protein